MGNQITEYSEALFEYRVAASSPLGEAWAALAEATDDLPNSQMRISHDVASMLRTLARSINASRAIDVGTFSGGSALALSLGLTSDGTVQTFDISDAHLDLARKYWTQAEMISRIEFRQTDATQALAEMAQTSAETFDIVFIDANKRAYVEVYESALKLVRPGGYVVIDDTLWAGKIVDSSCEDKQLPHLRAFNKLVAVDERVEATVLPIGNGLTVALKL